MRECFALSKRIPASKVDMRKLFPDSRDFTEIFEANPIPHHSAAQVVRMLEAEQAQRASKAGA